MDSSLCKSVSSCSAPVNVGCVHVDVLLLLLLFSPSIFEYCMRYEDTIGIVIGIGYKLLVTSYWCWF